MLATVLSPQELPTPFLCLLKLSLLPLAWFFVKPTELQILEDPLAVDSLLELLDRPFHIVVDRDLQGIYKGMGKGLLLFHQCFLDHHDTFPWRKKAMRRA